MCVVCRVCWDSSPLCVSCAGCVGVHGFSAVWGLIAAGLFTNDDDTLSTLGFVPSGGGLLYVSDVSGLCRRKQV